MCRDKRNSAAIKRLIFGYGATRASPCRCFMLFLLRDGVCSVPGGAISAYSHPRKLGKLPHLAALPENLLGSTIPSCTEEVYDRSLTKLSQKETTSSQTHHNLSAEIDRRISLCKPCLNDQTLSFPSLIDSGQSGGSLPEEHPASRCEQVVSILSTHVTA